MKSVRSLLLAVLLIVVPVISFAATKKSITIADPVSVGGTVLKPGDYKVEWDGTGSNVRVKFLQNNKAVATAPATVENKKTGYDGMLDMSGADNATKQLREIDFKDASIRFDQGSTPSGQ
jgi:hypothetical protein